MIALFLNGDKEKLRKSADNIKMVCFCGCLFTGYPRVTRGSSSQEASLFYHVPGLGATVSRQNSLLSFFSLRLLFTPLNSEGQRSLPAIALAQASRAGAFNRGLPRLPRTSEDGTGVKSAFYLI